LRFEELARAVEAAEDHWQNGRWREALEGYRDLLRRRLEDLGSAEAFQEADLLAIQRLADLAVPCGETQAADELLAALDALYRQRSQAWRADHAAIKRLHLALETSRLAVARQVLWDLQPSLGVIDEIALSFDELAQWEKQRPWPTAERPILLTQLYLGMGCFLAGLGQYRDALAVLERGLFHTEAKSPPLARQAALPLRLAIAAAQLEMGDLAAAGEALTALDIHEREHPGWVVKRCGLLAKLHYLRGEPQAAIDQLEQGVEICRVLGFSRAWLEAALQLAHVRILLNQTPAAERLLETVAEGAQTLGDPELTLRVEFLRQVAQARRGYLAEDEPEAASVTEIQSGVSGTATLTASAPGRLVAPRLARSVSCLAAFEERALELQVILAQRDLDGAAACLVEIEQIFGSTDSDLLQIRLRALQGMLAFHQGVAEPLPLAKAELLLRAEAVLQEVRPALRQLGLKPELYQLQRYLGGCLRHLQRPAEEREALASENQALLDDMAQSLPAEQRAAYLVNKWRADEEALALEIDALLAAREKAASAGFFLRPILYWKLLTRLGAFLDRIHREREALAREALGGAKGGSLKARPRLMRWIFHPFQRATLIFLVLPDRVFLARAGWMFFDFSVSPVLRRQVRDLVREWHEQSIGIGRDAARGAARTAQMLGDRLGVTAALQALPRRIRSLTIVPDDALHGFPFAAIPDRGRYLTQRFALSIAYQGTPRNIDRRGREVPRALIVGVEQAIGDLPRLEGTRRQLRLVIDWLARRGIAAAPVFDEAATRQLLLEQLPQARLCHLSCHGVFRPEQPEATGLVLLGNGGEEILSLYDLAGLSLSRVGHVTLVSCWAADNYIFPGRWVVSLPELLWRRGAGSVLGSLWEVEDSFAEQFLRRFYRALDRLPRDRALRFAQRCALRDRGRADPLWWSGFQLYGDPGKLIL